jgi:hypothetical protein
VQVVYISWSGVSCSKRLSKPPNFRTACVCLGCAAAAPGGGPLCTNLNRGMAAFTRCIGGEKEEAQQRTIHLKYPVRHVWCTMLPWQYAFIFQLANVRRADFARCMLMVLSHCRACPRCDHSRRGNVQLRTRCATAAAVHMIHQPFLFPAMFTTNAVPSLRTSGIKQHCNQDVLGRQEKLHDQHQSWPASNGSHCNARCAGTPTFCVGATKQHALQRLLAHHLLRYRHTSSTALQ